VTRGEGGGLSNVRLSIVWKMEFDCKQMFEFMSHCKVGQNKQSRGSGNNNNNNSN